MTNNLNKAILFCVCAAIAACKTLAPSQVDYYGANNTRAEVSFESYFIFKAGEDFKGPAADVLKAPYREVLDRELNEYLDYLTGIFLNYGPFADYPGSLYGKPTIKLLSASFLSEEKHLIKVNYSYLDHASFTKNLVPDSSRTYPIVLPARLDQVYEKNLSPEGHETCSMEESGKFRFWYYWNPEKEGCRLKPDDLITINAKFSPLPSTSLTYPDYETLLGDNGNGRDLEIVWVIGPEAYIKENDNGVWQYNAALKLFGQNPEFSLEKKDEGHAIFRSKRDNFDVMLKIYLMNYFGDKEFYNVVSSALQHADIFIFHGHSNYGNLLNPEALKFNSETVSQGKAQIFYFGGCRTFRYYNAKFFEIKPKNLDIITTTAPSYFWTFAQVGETLITEILNSSYPPWQSVINAMHERERKIVEYSGPRFISSIAVNGDEDNPTVPFLKP